MRGKRPIPTLWVVCILAAGCLIGFLIPEGGVSWSLFGFETLRFTVGEEQIEVRLDTSGSGWTLETGSGRIFVNKNGSPVLEGYILTPEEASACGENIPAEYEESFLLGADGSQCRVLFVALEDTAQADAEEAIQRLQLSAK